MTCGGSGEKYVRLLRQPKIKKTIGGETGGSGGQKFPPFRHKRHFRHAAY